MNAPVQIQIRDKVELRIPAGEGIGVFAVRVQDINSEGILIDRPVIDQRLLPAVKGKAIEIVFQRQDAAYSFKSAILKEDTLDRLPVLLIEPPRELSRIQRREFFRLDIDLPIRFRRLSSPGGESLTPPLKGMIINLSAGGVKFWTDLPDDVEIISRDLLMISFSLSSSYSVVGLEGRILSIEDDSRLFGRCKITCRFLNIPPAIQEAIVIHNIRYQQRYRVENRGR